MIQEVRNIHRRDEMSQPRDKKFRDGGFIILPRKLA
jgi:hypothetical protein